VLVVLAAVVPADAAAFTTTRLDATAWPRVGRLFLSKPGGTVKCSAAVVDAPNQSTLFTAGHCLNSADNGAATSASFAPGYHDGVSPFGRWDSQQLLPAPQWDTVNHHYDYGFIVLARNAQDVAVEDTVGAFPMGFNQPRAQNYRILGLPGDPTPPYDGQKLWACDTAYTGDYVGVGTGPASMMVDCDFGNASSGGPWLDPHGFVVSDTSFKPAATPPNTLTGPYLDGSAAALFATAGSIPVPEKPKATPHSTRKCKKHKGKRRHGATSAKKKCKKKHRRHH
jgi:hypothetical protein